MKVLVCGGRAFQNEALLEAELGALQPVPTLVIQGGAGGADALAERWAGRRGIHSARIHALWGIFGRAAGHVRNAAMLLLQPDLVVAFPGGRGTADMVSQAKAAGVRVIEVSAQEWLQ
jgi:hypothetical protein